MRRVAAVFAFLLMLSLSTACRQGASLPTPVIVLATDQAAGPGSGSGPGGITGPEGGSGPGGLVPTLPAAAEAQAIAPQDIPTPGGAFNSAPTVEAMPGKDTPTPTLAGTPILIAPSATGVQPTGRPPTAATLTSAPASVPGAAVAAVPSSGRYNIEYVAFMVARNETDTALPWRRCAQASSLNDPASLCPQATGSLADYRYLPSTTAASVQADSAGRISLAAGGLIEAHYLIVDRNNVWWVSPSLKGLDVIRWCGGDTMSLNVYDFTTDPGYDPYVMDVLDYFEGPGAGVLPAPLACPS